jgi:hypothetical protein
MDYPVPVVDHDAIGALMDHDSIGGRGFHDAA